uniref:nectin-4 n=1 Tax=Semicossyphus pulcher TaxID=241346 RepID=UPI0037E77432
MLLLVSMLILNTVTDALQVIGGSVTVVRGGTAVLPCKVVDTKDKIDQISWQRLTKGKPLKDNFFTILPSGPQFVNGEDDRFKFIGKLTDKNGTLQITNVTLIDEGTYTCIFSLYPSGNHKTDIRLDVQVPPVTSLKDYHPTLGSEEVALVTCTAAGSKPPAEVRWRTGTLAVRTTTNSTFHADGTTTTVSSLFGVPTREINNHSVQCVVTGPALLKEETLSVYIQIHFPPVSVIISERSSVSFECVTQANPAADITWTRSGQLLPESGVSVQGATLLFQKTTSDLNGLYQCKASNLYGKKQGYLFVHFYSGSCRVCWVLLGLLLVLIAVAAAAVFYLYKSGKLLSLLSSEAERPSPEMETLPTRLSTAEASEMR